MTLGLSPKSLIDRNKLKQKEWRENHPDRIKAFHLKYNTKPTVKERKLEWAREHREEINERRRLKYKSDRSEEHLKLDQPTTDSTDE